MNARRAPFDRVFFALVIAEVLFGFIMLASASGPLSFSRFNDSWYYARHQLFYGIIPGFIALLIACRVDYHRLGRAALPILTGSLILMLLVFIPGLAAEFGTAKSWIVVLGAFSFQPVEVVKLAFIIYVAALCSRALGARQAIAPVVFVFAIVGALLILQPDLGSLILFAAVLLLMFFSAGLPFHYVLGGAVTAAGMFYLFIHNAPYRAARLNVFLHPELDPQGIGYQINQALLAIGSGGIFGLGLGHSRQKFQYLPEVMGDSIFPIVAEELGFIFASGLIVLIAAIFFRGMRIASGAHDSFGRLLTIGMVCALTVQSFLNIGAMVGLLPLTGLPLTFVSYGGTAMVASLAAAGMILNVSRGIARE